MDANGYYYLNVAGIVGHSLRAVIQVSAALEPAVSIPSGYRSGHGIYLLTVMLNTDVQNERSLTST